jgi:hypothetical protein
VNSIMRRLSAWIGSHQQEISDRVHEADEKFAATQGWTVRRYTGRYGFGAREYRHPGFDQWAQMSEDERQAVLDRRLEAVTTKRRPVTVEAVPPSEGRLSP